MAAIIGNYEAADEQVKMWASAWVISFENLPEPRKSLAKRLAAVRAKYGSHEAREFRNYLLWVGCYPVKPCKTETVSTKTQQTKAEEIFEAIREQLAEPNGVVRIATRMKIWDYKHKHRDMFRIDSEGNLRAQHGRRWDIICLSDTCLVSIRFGRIN